MNYRHIFHAGNFADVFKHILLMLLTQSFLRKETPFCYLDTHAGVGRYDLQSEKTQKSKEYENGIQKLLTASNAPLSIREYLALIPKNGCFYPGSPEIVRHFLRQQDRMVLCELHPEDYLNLKKNFAHYKNIGVHHQDAYQGLKAFLPPKEKRGLILIDPPYEDAQEFSRLVAGLSKALQHFANGVYAIWYPIKNRQAVDYFLATLKNTISKPILNCELSIYAEDIVTSLSGCGMAIINPPFQFDQQLQEIMPWLWQTLSIHKQGRYQIKTL